MLDQGKLRNGASAAARRYTSVPGRTFCDLLRKHAVERPQTTAFVFLDSQGAVADQITFAALDRRARRIASELVLDGLSGQRVLLIFPPGLDFVAALFACFYSGAVAVPIPFLPGKGTADRIAAIHRDADPAGVLTLSWLRKEKQICQSALRTDDKLIWISLDALDPEVPAESLPSPSSDALALLQYTSGSISSPKGVMLSHANLIANCEMILMTLGHEEEARGLSWLPPFHDMGLLGHILYPIFGGGLSVLMSPLTFLYRPHLWLQAISTWKATTSGGPTFAFDLCLKAVRDEQLHGVDLSTWQSAYCGSERVQAEVLDRFGRRFEPYGFQRHSLLPSYGLAEATLLVTVSPLMRHLKIGRPSDSSTCFQPAVSCGKAPPGGRVIVVDPESKLILQEGAVGEIWVQGPHVAQGYWGAETDTNDVFRARLADGSGPYLRTGDLGFMKADELFVVGRIKNTIIIYGNKHSAEDLETAVMSSHELFTGFAGAAFGVDAGGQEQAVIVQEVKHREICSDELTAAAAHAFASVAREYGLRLFDIVLVRAGTLPRTANGKIKRAQARQKYLEGGFKRLNPHGRESQAGGYHFLNERLV